MQCCAFTSVDLAWPCACTAMRKAMCARPWHTISAVLSTFVGCISTTALRTVCVQKQKLRAHNVVLWLLQVNTWLSWNQRTASRIAGHMSSQRPGPGAGSSPACLRARRSVRLVRPCRVPCNPSAAQLVLVMPRKESACCPALNHTCERVCATLCKSCSWSGRHMRLTACHPDVPAPTRGAVHGASLSAGRVCAAGRSRPKEGASWEEFAKDFKEV